MKRLFIIFFILPVILSGDFELNPGYVSARNSGVVSYIVLPGNMQHLRVDSRHFDILLCYKTLVSNMRYDLEMFIPGFKKLVLLKCNGIK